MADKNAFTDREVQLMTLAWLCFDGEPKVDYKKLASLAGMGNPVSASNAWSKIKKKLAARAAEAGATAGDASGDGDDATTPKATKATPKKRGKKVTDEDDEEKTKGGKGKASTKKANTDDDGAETGPGIKTEATGEEDELL
ncbi:hypothetical protein AC578_458 [Pseudocercospora eumusae]|uniref:Uncharacterized protein n=1 Tax=Pseudocercospora eumusae TaxID=321146 RepID=A0A139HY93_9PEZI|nr:hypothetical protein AC578_458 [Pseudocercospora eumusae]